MISSETRMNSHAHHAMYSLRSYGPSTIHPYCPVFVLPARRIARSLQQSRGVRSNSNPAVIPVPDSKNIAAPGKWSVPRQQLPSIRIGPSQVSGRNYQSPQRSILTVTRRCLSHLGSCNRELSRSGCMLANSPPHLLLLGQADCAKFLVPQKYVLWNDIEVESRYDGFGVVSTVACSSHQDIGLWYVQLAECLFHSLAR
ncbi:hypothetical protein OG21DRAFT_669913 [Imleria badia]|nr:hypothetical protein OG21DRAFT_669913 [Imleria badia]